MYQSTAGKIQIEIHLTYQLIDC